MTDMVNHPPHYLAHPSGLECIEVTRLMPFTTGNAVKYIWRSADKNGDEDLRKARWYLKDHVANGLASRPSAKAITALRFAAIHDNAPRRQALLLCIADGNLIAAAGAIAHMLGDDDDT